MWKHTLSSISNEVLHDTVPGVYCVIRVEPPVTTEGFVKDYQLQEKDKGLSFFRLVSTVSVINFKYT